MYIWNMAADIYGFSDRQIGDMLYRNSNIDRFLESNNSMGISACKGMGKTYLLKVKRLSLMEDSSYLIYPKDQLVDTPGPIILSHSQIGFLSSYPNWVALWTFCICAYILSQDEFALLRTDEDLSGLPIDIIKIIKTKNDGVFHVLGRLIAKNQKSFLRDALLASGVLFQLVQRINRQVVLFVDKIEEPFNRGYYKIAGSSYSAEGKYNSSIWAYAQLSFAEAVYILCSGRHHVKIFYSIRQEALYGGEYISTEFSKIKKEMIAKLEYSYEDLENMFKKYVLLEQDSNLFDASYKMTDASYALCGISKIKHRSGKYETMWAYLYRHSLGRPRDIMEMSIALYENIVVKDKLKKIKKEERKRECRHWINQTATRICKEYIHVLEPFMEFRENVVFSQDIENFLSILPTNVFTLEAATKYCHQANNKEEVCECTSCKYMHFFSTLYNIGLLGYIYKSASESGYKNSIKYIGDSVFDASAQTLPQGELYYVHPGVGNMIQDVREKKLQKYINSNIIINSSEIFINSKELIRLKHLSNALLGNLNNNKIFITSTERHLKNERQKVISFLKNRGYEVMAFETPGFPKMPADRSGKGATHDHCIDVALSCKYLIYIFDGDFGGTYSGQDFKSYIEERREVISIEPSVSFVEYLVAKYYNKEVIVYVNKDVETARGEYIANGKPAQYKSKVVDNENAPKVFAQLGYFNALGNGTWYNKYSTISELEQYLDVIFPDLHEIKNI